jgi:hypothetical protein
MTQTAQKLPTGPSLLAYSLNDAWDAEGIKALEECIDSLDAELRDLSIQIHGE